MSLAERLNELAVANSEGLLNDDEYRLLRQNLFEEHSAGILPASPPSLCCKTQPLSRNNPHSPSIEIPSPAQDAPIKSPKSSLSFSSLLRRATGRWSSANSAPKGTKRVPDASRKPPPLVLQDTARTSMATSVSTPSSSNTKFGSTSPSNVSSRYMSSPVRDVFDEGSLVSAADLRAALSSTEEDCHKLTGAFNDLEANTLRRIRKRRARRLPMNTPTNVDVVLAGGEWREHRLLSPPSSPLSESSSRDHHYIRNSPSTLAPPPSPLTAKNGLLTRSASNVGLRKLAPRSSRDPGDSGEPHTDRRKHISGRGLVSSQSTLPSGWTGDNRSRPSQKHVRRNEGPPAPPWEQQSSGLGYLNTSSEVDPLDDNDDDDYPEDSQSMSRDIQALEDVRRKRDDLITRYTARLEFLRARLKSAEIQEKLRRK